MKKSSKKKVSKKTNVKNKDRKAWDDLIEDFYGYAHEGSIPELATTGHMLGRDSVGKPSAWMRRFKKEGFSWSELFNIMEAVDYLIYNDEVHAAEAMMNVLSNDEIPEQLEEMFMAGDFWDDINDAVIQSIELLTGKERSDLRKILEEIPVAKKDSILFAYPKDYCDQLFILEVAGPTARAYFEEYTCEMEETFYGCITPGDTLSIWEGKIKPPGPRAESGKFRQLTEVEWGRVRRGLRLWRKQRPKELSRLYNPAEE